MKTEYKIFGVVTAFLVLACGVYAWWTWQDSGGADGGRVEWIGVVALALSGLLCAMCAGYFWFVSRRIDPRPEDRDDAEIVDGAGEVGFFSPGSYWPFGIAIASLVTGLGLAYDQWWLVAAGLLAVLSGSGALLFEYYTGARRVH
jgi:Cytochrome c oxidase subunit IV